MRQRSRRVDRLDGVGPEGTPARHVGVIRLDAAPALAW